MTKTIEKPDTKTSDGAPPCWPPVAHIIDKRTGELKEGKLALCGAKMMGIDLEGMAVQKVCPKCLKIARGE